MTQWIREIFEKIFKKDWEKMDMHTIYGICHNVVKLEEHKLKEGKIKLFVHRKGATRSFPEQPVLLAGSMGTASYILIGTEIAMQKSFGSSAHGAGRVESRTSARKNISADKIKKELEKKGIDIEAGSYKGIVEEAPEVYKDIDEVVRVSNEVGIGKLVAKLIPIAVIKG